MFGYDIPLKPGVYEMRLHFAETHFGEMNLSWQVSEGKAAERLASPRMEKPSCRGWMS